MYRLRSVKQPVTHADMEKAKRALCSMDVVCLLDDFGACLKRITMLLNLDPSASVFVDDMDHRRTKGKPSTKTDNATLEMVESRNLYDVKLFQWAASHCQAGKCTCDDKGLPPATPPIHPSIHPF